MSTPNQEWTDEQVVGALLHIYSYQTADEQSYQSAIEDNGMGFNGLDAGICSNMAQFYKSREYLTPKQIKVLRKTLAKYHSQLPDPVPSLPIKSFVPKQAQTFQKTAIYKGDRVFLNFPFDKKLLIEVKTIQGRKWTPKTKLWNVPLSLNAIEQVIELGFELDSYIQKWWDGKTKKQVNITDIPGLGGTLREYQRLGVEFVESAGGKAIIGDNMGLGKTPQSLAYLQLHPEQRPAVVVCPASLKWNWMKEARMWLDNPQIYIMSGRWDGNKILERFLQVEGDPNNKIYIINYDILSNKQETKEVRDKKTGGMKKEKVEISCTGWGDNLIKILKPKAIIIDECHKIKNQKSLRTKATLKLAKSADCRMALSGTPIENRPIEFFTNLNLASSTDFPDFWGYATRYCNAKENGFGWDFTGHSNIKELYHKVRRVMIRRKKSEVLTELPPKERVVLPMEIKNRAKYRKALASMSDNFQLADIEILKQLAVEGKLDACIDWIEDYLESGKKLVVFATHKKVVDRVMKKFGKIAVKIDGSVPNEKRQIAVDSFQEEKHIRLFVGNIKAAGVGITLTAADSTCFLEQSWSPGEMTQAEDRVHRIGQESDSVTAYYPVAKDTIEEDIIELLNEKQKILDAVLDGKPVKMESIWKEILKKMES